MFKKVRGVTEEPVEAWNKNKKNLKKPMDYLKEKNLK
ncbi:hypothetical protein [Clostridium perfringens]